MPFTSRLPRSTPRAQGADAGGIRDFVDALESMPVGLHSFILLRHGQVIAEGWWHPYAPEHPHMMFSLSKSFTSTAVGIAISEGLFGLDDRVIDLLPDDVPQNIEPRLARLRVRHLLTMTTGHAGESLENLDRAQHDDWTRWVLGRPLEFEPGTHFVYNSGASYALSAIVQRLSGQRLVDYLGPRLFEPLGIAEASWETSPRGVNTGGWGLSLRTEDIAAFGQLYLQGGTWEGRRLIPADWVAQATSKLVANGDPADDSDWSQGYGFQFWRCRNGAYRGDGAFGQYCVVMKEQDAVLVMTGGLQDMQAPLDLAWKHLLPALAPGARESLSTVEIPPSEISPATSPAATSPAATRSASGSLAFPELRIPPQPGCATGPLSTTIAGTVYRFPTGSVALRNDTAGSSLTLAIEGVDRVVALGHDGWAYGTTPPFDGSSGAVAASGAWVGDERYVARLCFFETPFEITIVLTFAGDEVLLDIAQNVSFGDTRLLSATGSLVDDPGAPVEPA